MPKGVETRKCIAICLYRHGSFPALKPKTHHRKEQEKGAGYAQAAGIGRSRCALRSAVMLKRIRMLSPAEKEKVICQM